MLIYLSKKLVTNSIKPRDFRSPEYLPLSLLDPNVSTNELEKMYACIKHNEAFPLIVSYSSYCDIRLGFLS